MSVNSLYSPYGAYELKSLYQRNFMYGTLITLGFVVAIVGTSWIIAAIPDDTGVGDMDNVIKIETVADLGPPPSIAKRPPQVKVDAPQAAAPKVGIPKPVADDEVLDEDVTIATRDELAQIVAPDIAEIADDREIVVDIDEDDYLPELGEFVPVEIYPVMVYQHPAEYPRLAEQAGITGIVTVHALVGKDGSVVNSLVAKTSGTESLDDAAVASALKSRFKPGIQNGRPIACWVSYKIEFVQ